MRIGLFTVGLGGAAYPDVIRAVAETSERIGVATLWAAEHVVLFDRYDSAYPYSPSAAPGAPASTSRSCASSGAPGWRATRAS